MELKCNKSKTSIPGTINNAFCSRLMVSTGIAALDDLIGGGVPVGSVVLVEEDVNGAYAKTLLKYFIAEGVVNKHSTFVCSKDINPQNIVTSLPSLLPTDPDVDSPRSSCDKMKIAFRYENLPSVSVDVKHQFGHYYDLANAMAESELEGVDIEHWTGDNFDDSRPNTFSNPVYHELLKSIKNKIKTGRFVKDEIEKSNVLRIALHSLGSPMWLPNQQSLLTLDKCKDLDMFMYCLRAVISNTLAVAVITVPSHLYDEHSVERCIHSSDIAFRLQAFSGTELEKNATLSNYHGFFHLTKLAPINSLSSKHPGSVEYVFKLKRRKFIIEIFHLPPDIRDASENENTPNIMCATNNKNLLDF